MNNSANQSMSQSSYGTMGANFEPESYRLEREVNEFTQRLEHEKSQLIIIEEQIRQTKSELSERQKNVEAKRPTAQQDKKQKITLKRNNAILKNERLLLNQTKAGNEQLRRDINVLRKELTSSKNECGRLSKNIRKVKSSAEEQNKRFQQIGRIAEDTRVQIIALQAKYEEEKNHFDREIANYHESLQQSNEDAIGFDEKKKKKEREAAEAAEKEAKAEFANPIVILRRRLNKIIETNKEKRKLMDQYLRNVKVIEDAFDQIKQATGISNIEEIVTTFIKAEEQNYSLFNYVNALNTEYDHLEESNEEIKLQIQHIDERARLTKEEKLNLQKSLEDEVEMLKQEIDRNLNDAWKTKQMFAKIQSSVGTMVEMFKESKFYLCVAQRQNYKDGITFTENNIVQYLAEVEEYISSLITYTAFKNERDDAAITYIPLENLAPKDFTKKSMSIEKPMAAEVEKVDPDVHPNESEIVMARDLFARFNEHRINGNIVFQYPGGNRNQQTGGNKDEDDDLET